MFRFLLSFIVTLLILINSTYGQKVGVVMSGGGAKGLYHIGVLKALEENSIPIDYVAGTSMGAIVGSLYAAGYSPDEISQIATSGELSSWVSGRIDNNYGAYFREHSQFRKDDPILSVRVDPQSSNKSSLHLPSGIIPSIQIDMALSYYLSPATVACGGDFNNLMVPFMCIASDINSERQRVLFRDGDLGFAVRASMALPVAFKPLMKDDMILYDGGISDNFPWRPLNRHFSPDLIIGSSCSSGNVNTASDDISLMDQVFLLTMNRSDYDIPEDTGILIERDVPIGTLDFSQAQMVIDMGYEDTMERMDSIKLRASRRVTMEEFTQRRVEFRAQSPELIFNSYDVDGLNEDQEQYVHGYMETSRKGSKSVQREMSFEELKTNLYSILSSNNFSTEYPTITYDEATERYRFEIKLTNKPSLKFSFGGNLSSTAFNQIYLSASYLNIGVAAKTAYAELYLGPIYTTGIIGGRLDFYRRAPMFLDSYVCLSSKNLRNGNFGNVTDVENTLSVRTGESYLSLGWGFPISKRMMYTLRTNLGRESFRYDALNSTSGIFKTIEQIDQTKFRFATVKSEIERITLDKPLYPTRGSKLTISGIFLHGTENNFQADNDGVESFETIPKIKHNWYGVRLRYDKYITSPRSSAWFSMGLNLDGVLTNVDNFATTTASSLVQPSYQPTLHSNMVFMPEFSSRAYAAGGLIPQFTLMKNFYAQCGVYAMFRNRCEDQNGDVLFPIGDRYSMQFISDVALIYHTRIGPLSLALTKYNFANMDNMYLTFNFGYSMFSPKGTFY